ncbi:MAG: RNA polymerase sigma factor [Acidimicrobiales bacterium]
MEGRAVAELIRNGDPAARPMLQRDLAAAGGDYDALSAVLDPVASLAAVGDRLGLDALIWAVDSLGLAHRAIGRLVLDEADADDVAQEVLIAVAEHIGSYRGEARFTTWLHGVARNKAIAFLRRKHDTAVLADEVGDVARISSMIASRSVLDAAIAAIPDPYREAVVLRDIEGLSYEQVSDRLDVKLNTVRTRIARGRALAAANLAGTTR